MKKTLYTIVAIILLFNCSQKDNLIIPSVRVMNIHLGERLTDSNYDRMSLEIRFSEENLVNEIVVLNDQYETVKGAKVGLSFKEVLDKHGKPLSEHLSIKKSSKYPSKTNTNKPAEILIYDGIIFFQEKNTNKVKSILITNEPWY